MRTSCMANDGPMETISQETAAFFEAQNLMKPIVNNKRKISALAIYPYSVPQSDLSTSSSSTRSDSFEPYFVRKETDEIEVPAILESVETYAFMGFDDSMAQRIWSRYAAIMDDDDYPWGFLEFATGHIEGRAVDDAATLDDDWDQTMRHIGINDKLRRAILLPEYESIRYTGTCKFWLIDAMEVAFKSLEKLGKRLRREATRLQALGHSHGSEGKPSCRSPVSRKYIEDQLSPLTSSAAHGIRQIEDSTSLVKGRLASAPPLSIPDHTMLWRGCSLDAASRFYNVDTTEMNIIPIATALGDFNSRFSAYFTPQKEVAGRYASWLKHKVETASVAIIQLAVPDAVTKAFSVQYLWCDDIGPRADEWKRVVWKSRRRERLMEPELRHIKEADLLIGHIAKHKHKRFEDMKSWTEVNEDHNLLIDIDGVPTRAVQWVLNNDEAEEAVEEACSGKVWIHNLGALVVASSACHTGSPQIEEGTMAAYPA
ncbi:MAG: hypothetical protein M1825_003774 [Sarcosagium campestre]|nr:MAG: hypothetical protein M1825_003774 [Sarcosagium campestre]